MAGELVHETAPAPLTPARLSRVRFGFAVFLLTDAMLFLTLYATRFALAGTGHPAELNQAVGLALTLLMWLSLVPALWALRAGGRGDTRTLVGSLLVVILLGVLMLVGIAVDWWQLDLPGGGRSRYGGIFYTTLAIHALHMLGGLAALAGVAVASARGRLAPRSSYLAEGAVLFWIFVVAGWVVLYAVFYLA